ncbi:MAG TPA: type II toxin-antitoxin system Phd/YefM family antitoxin [Polyangiaceae bacterium]|nr:type II toxin-antitoxin system Phd/YefM family antitoxin [Polyangiaceae bacterium]
MPKSSTSAVHLDFELLSMTELRSRPGDVLDRVANQGSAFIIERNGERKACLVPLAALLPDIAPDRIARELKDLEGRGEEPHTTINDARELVFHFPNGNAREDGVGLTIVLPHGYPNRCPRVYVDRVDGTVPHRWADGALCLFGVMSAWNPGKHTVWSTLFLARRWLDNYDAWKKNGIWPKTGFTNE